MIWFRKSGKLNARGITQDIQRITLTTDEETEMDVTETLQTVKSSGIYIISCLV